MEERDIIRKRIRVVMYGRGLNTKQLAEKAGLSESHTQNLISGVFSSAPGRRKIEKALGQKVWNAPEIGGGSAAEKDLEQGTRKSQPGDLPLRPDAIGAGEAADIQRPTAASLPGSLCKERGEE
jgi:transcriptional regulator with XRE-family HTH domain